MPNRLADQTSPYLLQHKNNPVDWYPWGEEALSRARDLDRPIMLSIGYSACHWCHVMEHESFEDTATATLINEHFVPIKVDREERPDLDSIYMEAVQHLTGSGGWPMTMFLTPDCRPFYGGTYFPPTDRHGLPSFTRVLSAVSDLYRTRRGEVEEAAASLTETLTEQVPSVRSEELDPSVPARAAASARAAFDPDEGGFGRAPKFPQPMLLEFLLRAHRNGDEQALNIVQHTLTKMARGGMYDQLGGGFHRYSVDDRWLVPHFEKMLYDNAQLARVYLDAYRVTAEPSYRHVAVETLNYVQREMTSAEGGFYASQDADSEGEEGKFFLWTPSEVQTVLGADAAAFMRVYDVTPEGNFEGRTILHLEDDPEAHAGPLKLAPEALRSLLERARAALFAAREQRVKPGRDEKIITAWNGLMLRAFSGAAAALADRSYMQTAQNNADFLWSRLRRDGRLLRTYRDGSASLKGYLEDYAFLADGLLALYEAGGGAARLEQARALADEMIALFADPEGGPFYSTGSDHEQLIRRPRDLYDNAVPSGNSVAAEVLLRLAEHTGVEAYRRQALRSLLPVQEAMARHPLAFARYLCAADMELSAPRELAIIGDPEAEDTKRLLHVAARRFDPNLVIAVCDAETAATSALPLIAGRGMVNGRAAAYVCKNFVCRLPVSDPQELQALLEA